MNKTIAIPHSALLSLLCGTILGAMLVSAIESRWGSTKQMLFGELGLLTIAGAIITLGFLGYRALIGQRTLANSQEALAHSQRAEVAARFQKGMELLANTHQATRIGGLYILRDIATAEPDTYWPSIVDSIVPFVHSRCETAAQIYQDFEERIQADDEPDENSLWLRQTPRDVVVALNILGRGWSSLREAVAHLPAEDIRLNELVLANVELRNLFFGDVSFDDAIIQNVLVKDCQFIRCEMNVKATAFTFKDCDLTGTNMFLRNMVTGLANTKIDSCILNDTKLDGNKFTDLTVITSDVSQATLTHPSIVQI